MNLHKSIVIDYFRSRAQHIWLSFSQAARSEKNVDGFLTSAFAYHAARVDEQQVKAEAAANTEKELKELRAYAEREFGPTLALLLAMPERDDGKKFIVDCRLLDSGRRKIGKCVQYTIAYQTAAEYEATTGKAKAHRDFDIPVKDGEPVPLPIVQFVVSPRKAQVDVFRYYNKDDIRRMKSAAPYRVIFDESKIKFVWREISAFVGSVVPRDCLEELNKLRAQQNAAKNKGATP